jgi:DNA-binding XRE family transcriptional regulator
MASPGGYVYAIGAEGTSLVKIGSALASVEDRRKLLQTGHPSPLHILAKVPVEADVRRVESRIHAFLATERHRGEWFDITIDTAQLTALVVRALEYLAAEDALPKRSKREPSSGIPGLGERIRQTREAYGMSQAELARRVGISYTAMNQIESGEIVDPRASRVRAIARALKTTTDYLLGTQEDDDEEDQAA